MAAATDDFENRIMIVVLTFAPLLIAAWISVGCIIKLYKTTMQPSYGRKDSR